MRERSGAAWCRRINVEAMPPFEREQAPQTLTVIALAAGVIADQAFDGGGLEQAASLRFRAAQHLAHLSGVLAQPRSQRHAEAVFLAVNDVAREQAPRDLLEDVFSRAAVDLEVERDGRRHFD